MSAPVHARRWLDWSTTEGQGLWGKLDNTDEGRVDLFTFTLQHADEWRLGDDYGFVHYFHSKGRDGESDTNDFYGEWYSNLSLEKNLGRKINIGPIRDIGVIGGVNFGPKEHFLKFLPGIRMVWDVPWFTFLNTDVMAYIDFNGGVHGGGVPKERNSWMVDVNGVLPFTIAGYDFSMEGHVEYVPSIHNELQERSSWWVLTQIELRRDVSKHVSLGVECEYWKNVHGHGGTDQHSCQVQVGYRL